ncbi:MAG TPA: hypothetical protein VIM37_01830 [Candidatus Microsaccharimonas sp.]
MKRDAPVTEPKFYHWDVPVFTDGRLTEPFVSLDYEHGSSTERDDSNDRKAKTTNDRPMRFAENRQQPIEDDLRSDGAKKRPETEV